MPLHSLRGDGRTGEMRFLRRWLEAAHSLRDAMFEGGDGFDPLRYNETATVGLLVAAAGRAGLFALPEFTESHRKLPEGRVRAGRCDLWIADEDWSINWLIEFKLFWYPPGARKGLVRCLNKAVKCVFERDSGEAGRRFGCAVYHPSDDWLDQTDEQRAQWKAPERIEALAAHADYGFRLDGEAPPAYILLKEVSPRARHLENYQIGEAVLKDQG